MKHYILSMIVVSAPIITSMDYKKTTIVTEYKDVVAEQVVLQSDNICIKKGSSRITVIQTLIDKKTLFQKGEITTSFFEHYDQYDDIKDIFHAIINLRHKNSKQVVHLSNNAKMYLIPSLLIKKIKRAVKKCSDSSQNNQNKTN